MAELQAHVVDDDDAARLGLAFLLESAEVPVVAYASALEFLAVAEFARGVVVTDIRMPQMDGLELVRQLSVMGARLPVIVMTGHGDVPLAVEAMKAGVIDFIEKPYDNERMLRAISEALAAQGASEAQHATRSQLSARLETLSARERQVLCGLVAGKPNKAIANDLAISPRTVEIYRAHVMSKMQVRSLSELVRVSLMLDIA